MLTRFLVPITIMFLGIGIYQNQRPPSLGGLSDLTNSVFKIRVQLSDRISNGKKEFVYEYGSGVLINKKGYIITSAHIFKEATTFFNDPIIEVSSSKSIEFIKAELISTSIDSDIAVLKIAPYYAMNFQPISSLSKSSLRENEVLWALGLRSSVPIKNEELIILRGMVTNDENKIEEFSGKEKFKNQQILTFSQMVEPGMSGGPIINGKNEIVGIIRARPFKEGKWAGFSIGVPSSEIQELLDVAIKAN